MDPLAVNGENSRFEKSLGLLTTKFVSLLQEAEDGLLDLKVVRNPFGDECLTERSFYLTFI